MSKSISSLFISPIYVIGFLKNKLCDISSTPSSFPPITAVAVNVHTGNLYFLDVKSSLPPLYLALLNRSIYVPKYQ